jgi:hypothetical protein
MLVRDGRRSAATSRKLSASPPSAKHRRQPHQREHERADRHRGTMSMFILA